MKKKTALIVVPCLLLALLTCMLRSSLITAAGFGICIAILLLIAVIPLASRKHKQLANRALALTLCAALIGPIFILKSNHAHASDSRGSIGSIEHSGTINSTDQEEHKDTDGDGVADYLEKFFGSDPTVCDTDGDGLNDHIELFVLSTNPTLCDSNGDGISDANSDADGDGLTNIVELRYGTSLTDPDSDGDGLSDYDEIRVHFTDALKADSDGDGLLDGEEVALGLNPAKRASDGKQNDSLRKFHQTLPHGSYVSTLFESNVAVPALSGYVSGAIERHVSVSEAAPFALKSNSALIGKCIHIESDYSSNQALKLSFDCKKLGKSAATLIICRYDGGRISPISSTRNGSTVSAEIACGGDYFLMDAERLLMNIGSPAYRFIKSYRSGKSTGLPQEPERSEIVNDGTWVLLSDYQFIRLASPLSDDGFDTDGDGVSDRDELGTHTVYDVTPYINWVLSAYDIPEGMYQDSTSVTVYDYNSNPLLPDTDFDGRNDNIDHLPRYNLINGKLKTNYATNDISLNMDYRWFFGNNTEYNAQLSKASIILASIIYGGESRLQLWDADHFDSSANAGIENAMNYLGLQDPIRCQITGKDNHHSEVALAHRTLNFDGVERTVLAVVVRGTNGTTREWSSNFDTGDLATFDSTSDWTDAKNHKGFDIIANRIISTVNSYISAHGLDSSKLTYWVTGHSRGAGAANIIGAKFEAEGKRAFVYTFAAPNTALITRSAAESYRTVFNLVNTDDLVCYLPMSGWGYTRYGRTASLSLANNFEREWEQLTGIGDYNPDTIGMQNTVAALTDVVHGDPRLNCYKYTCSCHGDGSSHNITIRNKGISKNSREIAIAKIPENALPYCIITRYNGRLLWGWDFEVCQSPAYFMQLLAAKMGGSISNYRFAVELNIATRYEAAKAAIIRSAISGIAHPHTTEAYYVMTNHFDASLFN